MTVEKMGTGDSPVPMIPTKADYETLPLLIVETPRRF
jgi:hypothetical protein